MIGREKEKRQLLSYLEEEESQFVAVLGRRRIGKTYLIRETFEYDFTFSHTGESNTLNSKGNKFKKQLDKFVKSLNEYGYYPSKKITTWDDAFDGLKEIIKSSKKRKKVIFIDELSWMDTKGSGLISALENFWNGWVSARIEKDIVLIVCASATYWMINNVVNSRGGLHNRLTGYINLKPFTLNECEQYVKSKNIIMSQHQILQCYMIFGGVPFYWSLLKKGKSLPQNIDEILFSDNAILKNEYDNLYRSLFNKPEQYIKIIEALTKQTNGLTRDEISSETKIPTSGDFTKKLEELEHCGFIRKYIPFGYKQNKVLYQLMDNFTLFYHKFMKNQNYDENFWKNSINTPRVNAWSGLAFEKVVLQHLAQLKSALGISQVQTEVNSWKCNKSIEDGINGSQIDLIIVRKDQIINVVEMKYSELEYNVDQTFYLDMKRKIADFKKVTKTKYAIHSTLVTTYGVLPSPYASEIHSVISCFDLFE